MDTFSNDSQVLFKYFNYHPISEALYDIDGAMIDINYSMKKRYDITDKSLFFLNHLFENTFLTDHQKEELKTAKAIYIIRKPIQITIIPLQKETENNDCIGYYLSITDMTSEKNEMTKPNKADNKPADKASESQTLMELALQNSRATLYSFDFNKFKACDKVHCNQCIQLYGSKNHLLQKNQYICKSLSSLQQAEDQAKLLHLINKIREEKLEKFTTNFGLKNDNSKYCNYEITGKTKKFDNDGKPCLIVGCIIDNQEYIEHEEILQKAKEKAEISSQLKSVFLANMTHDIRTPLHAIVGFAELLSDEIDLNLRHEYINIIKTNNELLVKLINDILDISKIESDLLTFDYVNVPLQPLMKDIYMTIQLKMKKGIELVLDPCSDQTLYIDKSRLSQVLINLLTNAIKHTATGSIHFGYKCEDGFIRFYVSDTGCGIPEEEIKNIFSRFTQIGMNKKDGVGLGLAICKGLVTKMSGTISVCSKEGAGSTFTFTIPHTVTEKGMASI